MSFRDTKITIRHPGPDELEEVRLRDIDDPETTHLWGYRWIQGPDETIDLSDYIRTIEIKPSKDDA